MDGVAGVHHLHIWPLSTTETALTAHLVVPGAEQRRACWPGAGRCFTTASKSIIARSRSSATTRRTADVEPCVTHLECSLTGEHYAAGEVHNLSRAGKPLLVRYDLEAAARTLTGGEHRRASPGHVEMARAAAASRGEPVSLGEGETPIIALTQTGGSNLLVKDEGRLPTGSFKARGLAMAVTMARELGITRIAMPTNGNAGAALAAYGARGGHRDGRHLPRRNTDDQRHRDRGLRRHGSMSRTARSTSAARWSARARRGPLVRLLDA